MRLAVAVCVAIVAFSVSASAQPEACPDAEWVSFSLRTPYTPEVQAVVPDVWLPQLIIPCPYLGLGIGAAQLPVSIAGGSAGNIALAHSICMALGYWPCLFSVVGAPLFFIEAWYVAPVTVLNAMDRDVRCARAGRLQPSSSNSASAPTMTAPTKPPPATAPTTTMPPAPPRRDDALPPPPPPPGAWRDAPESPRRPSGAMAW